VKIPDLLHLLDPVPKTRRDLIDDERARRAGVRVVWIPWFVVRLLSGMAWMAQKILRPSRPAIKVSSAFAAPKYDTSRVASLLERSSSARAAAAEEGALVMQRFP